MCNQKQKLTHKQQIEHMKTKGIRFEITSEADAEEFLANNNAAVENITRELPNAKDVLARKCNTSLFDVNKASDSYFADTATALQCEASEAKISAEQKAWGLISARLGNQTNVSEFKNTIWFGKHSIQNEYKGDIPSWEAAKEKFKVTSDKVQKTQSPLVEILGLLEQRKQLQQDVDHAVEEERQCFARYNKAKDATAAAKKEQTELKQVLASKEKDYEGAQKAMEGILENIHLASGGLHFSQKLLPALYRKNPLIVKIKELKKKRADLSLTLIEKNEGVQTAQQKVMW